MAANHAPKNQAGALMSNLGFRSLLVSLTAGAAHRLTTPLKPSKRPIAAIAAIPEKPAPPDYKTARSLHRSGFADFYREHIPEMMQTFRCPPENDDEHEYVEWLAERDALIERAMALGYAIGELHRVAFGTRAWSAEAIRICGTSFSYPVGGSVTWQAPPPKNGDATLLSRGWAMLDAKDTEPRPHIPIPLWFLLEPITG